MLRWCAVTAAGICQDNRVIKFGNPAVHSSEPCDQLLLTPGPVGTVRPLAVAAAGICPDNLVIKFGNFADQSCEPCDRLLLTPGPIGTLQHSSSSCCRYLSR